MAPKADISIWTEGGHLNLAQAVRRESARRTEKLWTSHDANRIASVRAP